VPCATAFSTTTQESRVAEPSRNAQTYKNLNAAYLFTVDVTVEYSPTPPERATWHSCGSRRPCCPGREFFDDLARRASDALDVHPEQAVALYQRALALRPGWAEGWLYRGASLFQLGRFREARDSLRPDRRFEVRPAALRGGYMAQTWALRALPTGRAYSLDTSMAFTSG
jgi:tetratricopeptide (TPR) repeat protein